MAVKWCPPPANSNDTANLLIPGMRVMRPAAPKIIGADDSTYLVEMFERAEDGPDNLAVDSFYLIRINLVTGERSRNFYGNASRIVSGYGTLPVGYYISNA